MTDYCFGVDLGGTTVKLGLFDMAGTILDKWEIKTRTENGGSQILPDIAVAVLGKMAEKGLTREQVCGIGFGVPGPVLEKNIVNNCVNLGWGRVAAADELKALTGMPVVAGNDANVAALGEQWLGGGKGYENVVMITLGTGVGGGVIVGGRILAGADGAAGEIGHITMLAPEDVAGPCNCGKTGCLEQATSANGLVSLTKLMMARRSEESCLRTLENMTAKDILDAAKAGDALALASFDRMADYLGRAASYIGAVVNPDVFVIGGGVSKAGEILTQTIARHYRDYAMYAMKDTPFKLATLGNDAGICGAARMIINCFR